MRALYVYLVFFGSACAQLQVIFEDTDGTVPKNVAVNFTLRKCLGQGATAAVYEVTSERGDKFAIKHSKIPLKGIVENEWMVTQKLSNSISYPAGVLKIVGHGMSSGSFSGKVLLMEFVDSDNLYQMGYDSGQSTVYEILSLAQDIVNSLEAFYKCGITHRDLKSENILFRNPVTKSGAVLIDFGFAHFEGSPVDHKFQFGSPLFKSPNIQRRGTPNPYDDLRALMYLMASPRYQGKLPWAHDCEKLIVINLESAKRKVIVQTVIDAKVEFEANLEHNDFLGSEIQSVLLAIRNVMNTAKPPEDYTEIRVALELQMSSCS